MKATRTRRTFQRVKGYVWCESHGAVHSDSVDPYDYGEPDCRKDDHAPLYARLPISNDPLPHARAEKE